MPHQPRPATAHINPLPVTSAPSDRDPTTPHRAFPLPALCSASFLGWECSCASLHIPGKFQEPAGASSQKSALISYLTPRPYHILSLSKSSPCVSPPQSPEQFPGLCPFIVPITVRPNVQCSHTLYYSLLQMSFGGPPSCWERALCSLPLSVEWPVVHRPWSMAEVMPCQFKAFRASGRFCAGLLEP